MAAIIDWSSKKILSWRLSNSMDGKGRSIDNICIERFWRTLKYEDVYLKNYNTIKEAKEGIREYINRYNQTRLHSSIDYATPDEVYFEGVNNLSFNNNNQNLLRNVS